MIAIVVTVLLAGPAVAALLMLLAIGRDRREP